MTIYEYNGELLARIDYHYTLEYLTPRMKAGSHEVFDPTAWTFKDGKAFRIGFDDAIADSKTRAYIPVDHWLVRDLVRLAKEEGRLRVKKVAA